ncbi:MAG: hypothetical protein HRU33_17950 [Rhodobacteraceae bacterium]|nr:hypothetical protein [Paracoccaceae bacterium]
MAKPQPKPRKERDKSYYGVEVIEDMLDEGGIAALYQLQTPSGWLRKKGFTPCYATDRAPTLKSILQINLLLGIASACNIPELETSQLEHRTLGSVGVPKLPRRGLSALEGSIKLGFPEPELVALCSKPRKAVSFQVHQKLDIFKSFCLDEDGEGETSGNALH